MILNPQSIPEVREVVDGAAFYSAGHASVFVAACRCFSRSQDVDLVLLKVELGDAIEEVGGPEYLVRLAESVPSGVNWPHYARIVADHARRRRIIDACGEVLYAAYHDSNADQVEAMLAGKAASLGDARAGSGEMSGGKAFDLVLARLRSGQSGLLPTGIAQLDAMGGVPEAGVTIVLGVPGSGKTSLVVSMLQHFIFTLNRGVGVFSFEVDGPGYMGAIVQQASGIPISGLQRRGGPIDDLTHVELAGWADKLDVANIFVSHEYLTAEQMFMRAAAWKREGVSVIVNDYIQNNPPMYPGQSEYEAVTRGMGFMRRIANELGIATIVVSQPTIGAARTDRPLRASDCKGSGAIWETADLMLSVYRACVGYPRDEGELEENWNARKRRMEIHVLKNKRLGLVGAIDADFDPATTRITA